MLSLRKRLEVSLFSISLQFSHRRLLCSFETQGNNQFCERSYRFLRYRNHPTFNNDGTVWPLQKQRTRPRHFWTWEWAEQDRTQEEFKYFMFKSNECFIQVMLEEYFMNSQMFNLKYLGSNKI